MLWTSKCLAFCQTLTSSKQKVTFNLSMGKDTFKLKELSTSSCMVKKKTPSQMRREARRREEFRKNNQSDTTAETTANVMKMLTKM